MAVDKLFAPRSIAVFGASENPAAVSWRILTSLERLGFEGRVLPVNPRRETVLGHRCYPSIAALPEVPDAIAFCVTRDVIETHFQQAAEAGIGGAAIFATGFADAGAEGHVLEARLTAIARGAEMAVAGPNGMGILNPASRSSLYSGIVERPELLPGNVGVITQSGAIAVGLLTDCRRFGFSHVVSSGNEAVTQLHDFLSYLVDDPATRVIALFVEAVRDVASFTEQLDRAAAAGKPVVVLKVGKSERGKHAVRGHTGAVAGAGNAFSALLRRHRAIEVATPDEMNEVLATCQSTRLPRGPRIGHITASGGQVDMILDNAERDGFDLPPLAESTKATLGAETGISTEVSNPLDAWGNGDWQRNLPLALEAFGADPSVDNVVFTSDTNDGQPMRPTDYAGFVAEAAVQSDKPHFFFNTRPSLFRQENVERLRDTGVAVIGGIGQGLGAIHRLGTAALAPPPRPRPPLTGAAAQFPDGLRARASIHEAEAKRILSEAGITCTGERLCDSTPDLRAAAAELGFPLVLKVVSDRIPHRSDHGLVALDLASEAAVLAKHERMEAILESMEARDGASYLLAQQVSRGVEAFIGVTRDPELGLCLALGPGGILVELISDVAMRPLPLCDGDAEAMIGETRLAALLSGLRGTGAADRAGLATAIERIGDLAFAWQDAIDGLDINPLMVLPEGQGTVIADAVIFPAVGAAKTSRHAQAATEEGDDP